MAKGVKVRNFNAICYRINGSGMEEANPRNRVQFYLPAAILFFDNDGEIESVETNGGKIFDTNKMGLINCEYQLFSNC